MDRSSCIARRTRSQTDLYFKSLVRNRENVPPKPKLEKRKRRRLESESEDDDSDVVIIREVNGDGGQGQVVEEKDQQTGKGKGEGKTVVDSLEFFEIGLDEDEDGGDESEKTNDSDSAAALMRPPHSDIEYIEVLTTSSDSGDIDSGLEEEMEESDSHSEQWGDQSADLSGSLVDVSAEESEEEKRVKIRTKEEGKMNRGGCSRKNVFRLLADSMWEKEDEDLLENLPPSKEETPEKYTDPPCSEETLLRKFSFGIYNPVQKSGHENDLDDIWKEMDFNLKSIGIGSKGYPAVSEIDRNESAHDASLCSQGIHNEIVDLELGIRCTVCGYVRLEIKYFSSPMEKDYHGSGRENWYRPGDRSLFDELYSQLGIGDFHDLYNSLEGTVWDMIPEAIRRKLYPHQLDGLRFIWENIAGTFNLAELKRSDTNEHSEKSLGTNQGGGCIISHAPGTGKTGLTMVFLHTYLQLFPKCRPVILAPSSVLLNWEEEFKKWKVDVPFHNLNVELSEVEAKFVDHIKKSGRKVLSKNEKRMVKLFLWKEKPSILAVSYKLFEKLAGGKFITDEGKRKKRKSAKEENKVAKKSKEGVVDKESEEIRKILLELPRLVVLDEGHTPRNHRSGIWKVLSKVRAEKRIILSGTPFQNNFMELYNTLCLVRPSFTETIPLKLKKFCQKRLMPMKRDGKEQCSDSHRADDKPEDEEIEELKALMSPFVHVHKGDILKKKLHGLKDCVVMLNPPDLQKELLKSIESHWLKKNSIESHSIFDFERKLSVGSVHPSLFLEKCCLSKNEKSAIDQVLSQKHRRNTEAFKKELRQNPNEGAKMRFLVEFIRLAEALGERVLVFSQYIDPLEFVVQQLKMCFNWSEGKQVLYMDGKLNLKQRQSLIKLFNDPKSEAKVLLASTRACSEGIHLVGASRVILLDVVWNPSVERQAISRAYRLGQKRVVYTYHLMISGTSESAKYCTQVEKDRISELVFSSRDEKKRNSDVAYEDRILDEMIAHGKLQDMFEKIIYQPKESEFWKDF